MNPLIRLMSIAGGLTLLIPGTLTDIVGIVPVLLMVVIQNQGARKAVA